MNKNLCFAVSLFVCLCYGLWVILLSEGVLNGRLKDGVFDDDCIKTWICIFLNAYATQADLYMKASKQ